jgi:DNA replication protein DnaC
MPTPQTSEPVAAGSTLPTTFVDLLEFDWEAGKDVKVTCPECHGTFMHNEHLAAVFPGTHCDDCCESVMAKKAQEELTVTHTQALVEKVQQIIPPLYQETDPEKLPYAPRQEVMAWEDRRNAKGLWMVGDTRTGKTRTLCLLLERLLKEGKEVRAFFHGGFTDDLLEVLRSERSFKAWKRKVTKTPIMAIDDLFSNKMTERSEAALFEILDERIAWQRPTFVTTQVTAKDALSRFHSTKRCEGFFSRVKEFFQIIPFAQDKQEEMKV